MPNTTIVARAPLSTQASPKRSSVAAPERYYKRFKISHPAYSVNRISGHAIRERAQRYFSGALLEIGCGTKRKAMLVGDCVERHYGIDIPECSHDQSKIDAFATAYRLPFKDGVFDCVLSTAVIEHLEDPGLMLREAARVLAPGGYAILTAPQYWHLHEAPRDFFRFTKYGLAHLCDQAGFEIVENIALSGFLITFATQFGYWLRSVCRGPFKLPARALVAFNNMVLPALDRGGLRREGFAWMHLVVVRVKPRA